MRNIILVLFGVMLLAILSSRSASADEMISKINENNRIISIAITYADQNGNIFEVKKSLITGGTERHIIQQVGLLNDASDYTMGKFTAMLDVFSQAIQKIQNSYGTLTAYVDHLRASIEEKVNEKYTQLMLVIDRIIVILGVLIIVLGSGILTSVLGVSFPVISVKILYLVLFITLSSIWMFFVSLWSSVIYSGAIIISPYILSFILTRIKENVACKKSAA